MRKILLPAILLFVASMVSRAQTKESDAIFAQGVSLYNKGKYKDAINLFERGDSIGKQPRVVRQGMDGRVLPQVGG